MLIIIKKIIKIIFSFILISCNSNSIDLIVFNAKIYTANYKFDTATSFAVNDGRFIDIGGSELVSKYKSKSIVDAKGMYVFPGFIDSHTHVLNSFLYKNKVNPSTDEKVIALKEAQSLLFKNGITTISEAGIDFNDIQLIDSLQKKNELSLRIYGMINYSPENLEYFTEKGPFETEKINVRSFKVYADGALGSRGAALKKPYSDLKSHKGEFITPKDSLEKLAYMLATTPFQMNTHAIGDDANRVILEAYNKALVFSDDPRWRVEHAQIIDTADITLFNRKIIPSVQPTHATSDMYWAEERLGADRLQGAYAYKSLLEMSGRISLGTDFPVEEVSPIQTFFAAVARQDKDLYPEGGYLSKNKLSRLEALRGMTQWGAYASFEENQKGSIEVGKVADFVILDRDIITVKESSVLKARIVATLLDGNIVYSNRIN